MASVPRYDGVYPNSSNIRGFRHSQTEFEWDQLVEVGHVWSRLFGSAGFQFDHRFVRGQHLQQIDGLVENSKIKGKWGTWDEGDEKILEVLPPIETQDGE